MRETITKSDWLAAQQCLGETWYGLRTASTPPDEAELFRMEQGQEIGGLARELYLESRWSIPSSLRIKQ